MPVRASRPLLAAILAGYFVLAVLFAVYTPAWEAPDEPAHYNYVRDVAVTGSLPVLHFGDYPHAYMEEIKQAQFRGMSIEPIRYESHQPPLYYVLLAPVFAATGGDLTALRLASVLLGAGIVVLAYATGRRIFPRQPALALGAAAFVAFLPQHLATVSQVGNDVLAELLFAAALYLVVIWVQGSEAGSIMPARPNARAYTKWTSPWVAGVLLGLVLVTKTTAYIAVPLVAFALAWRWGRERAGWQRILREGVAVAIPAVLIAAPWFARNAWAYGWPDIFGLIRHDQIVTGQPRAAGYIAENGWWAYWRRAVDFTFKSFWGAFGWLGVFMDSRVYLALALFSGMVSAGAVARALSARRDGRKVLRPAVLFLVVSALLTLLTYVYYNTNFLQHQGRYLFTALIPISLLVAAGWSAVVRPPAARALGWLLLVAAAAIVALGLTTSSSFPKWPFAITLALAAVMAAWSLAARREFVRVRLQPVAFALPFLALPVLAAYGLFGVIVPQLTR